MTDEDSPIIDFYPSTFEIDMNGKKMAWQGVAILPFIDQARLLDAMAIDYPNLIEEENKRNSRSGNHVIYTSDAHPLYPFYEALYGKRKSQEVSSLTKLYVFELKQFFRISPFQLIHSSAKA
jgi:5'-3' exoribonuclease 2